MTRRIAAVLTMIALVLFSFAPAQAAASNAKKDSSEGLVLPLQASTPDQGSFVGVLKITRFARDGNGIVAVGLVTGTLTDELGVMTGIVRTVSLPLQLPGTASRQAVGEVVIQQTCDVLHLTLGPLHLDLLPDVRYSPFRRPEAPKKGPSRPPPLLL